MIVKSSSQALKRVGGLYIYFSSFIISAGSPCWQAILAKSVEQ